MERFPYFLFSIPYLSESNRFLAVLDAAFDLALLVRLLCTGAIGTGRRLKWRTRRALLRQRQEMRERFSWHVWPGLPELRREKGEVSAEARDGFDLHGHAGTQLVE